MTKIQNSIGTVNYLHKITKDKNSTINNNNNNITSDKINCLATDNMVLDVSSTKLLAMPTAHIIISTAIAELRNTLFFYPLVFLIFISLI